MGVIKAHRTWPCRMQESYEIRSLWVIPSPNGQPDPKPCPLHGPTCPKMPASKPDLPGVVGGSATATEELHEAIQRDLADLDRREAADAAKREMRREFLRGGRL